MKLASVKKSVGAVLAAVVFFGASTVLANEPTAQKDQTAVTGKVEVAGQAVVIESAQGEKITVAENSKKLEISKLNGKNIEATGTIAQSGSTKTITVQEYKTL